MLCDCTEIHTWVYFCMCNVCAQVVVIVHPQQASYNEHEAVSSPNALLRLYTTNSVSYTVQC